MLNCRIFMSEYEKRGGRGMLETKVVVGAEEYNNNPGWLHTNEEELNLLRRETWLDKFQPNSLSAILA